MYRILILAVQYTLVTFQVMDLVLNVDNAKDFTDNLYIMMNVFVSGYKLIVMWRNYEDIDSIIKSLTEEPFKPLDTTEMEIRQKFDMRIK